jgi:hypothetical protein
MQEHIMGEKVNSIWKIEVDSNSLTLTADNRSHKVTEGYQISHCRFRFVEAMFFGI